MEYVKNSNEINELISKMSFMTTVNSLIPRKLSLLFLIVDLYVRACAHIS